MKKQIFSYFPLFSWVSNLVCNCLVWLYAIPRFAIFLGQSFSNIVMVLGEVKVYGGCKLCAP